MRTYRKWNRVYWLHDWWKSRVPTHHLMTPKAMLSKLNKIWLGKIYWNSRWFTATVSLRNFMKSRRVWISFQLNTVGRISSKRPSPSVRWPSLRLHFRTSYYPNTVLRISPEWTTLFNDRLCEILLELILSRTLYWESLVSTAFM